MDTQDGNTPTLTTQRLILKKFCETDLQAMFLLLGDKEINTFLDMLPLKNIEEAKTWLQEQYLEKYKNPEGYHYAVCLKEDNVPIGFVEVIEDGSNDIGYAFRKEVWHHEIATEAVKAVIERLKKDGLPFVTASHDVNNPHSGQVMKKVGMKYEYTYRDHWLPKDKIVDFRMYQLNLDDEKDRVYRGYWDNTTVHYIEHGEEL